MVIDFDNAIASKVKLADNPANGVPGMARPLYNRADKSLRPLCQTSPVSGVLAVNQFNREELEAHFVDDDVVSGPLLNFNDGFAIYRELYKSVMVVYLQLVAMPKSEHTRQMNVFALTLRPHGSNFHDVIQAVEPLRTLVRDLTLKIK
ncbi:hypothetical protein FJTKL_02526 [Diaporthe vaccinii]|uniref:Uncharacterized protein n=1 Tax=Diaporthe vaccinii TaxID=105482 RepID=A0ABR4DY24_9PEZI